MEQVALLVGWPEISSSLLHLLQQVGMHWYLALYPGTKEMYTYRREDFVQILGCQVQTLLRDREQLAVPRTERALACL